MKKHKCTIHTPLGCVYEILFDEEDAFIGRIIKDHNPDLNNILALYPLNYSYSRRKTVGELIHRILQKEKGIILEARRVHKELSRVLSQTLI